MIVRLWPDHHKDSALREELLQALKKYPDFCDEVWLCMEFETFSKEAHKESARAMAVAAERLRNAGIGVSIQGITLGHGDDFESGAARPHPARSEEVVAKVQKQIEEEIVEVGKRTAIDLGIHGLHPELIRMIGKMKYRSSYGQNLLQHARETANLAGIMAAELGLNPKTARRAGLLHDIGKVPDDEPELPHAIIGMKLAEKYKEKPEVCNAIGAHHDEIEMSSLIAPIIQVCDAISGARPGARREVVESYIKRLKEMEDIALSYPGVVKTYTIQAGRELRVIVGAEKLSDMESESLSHDIAKKIQDEMTYPGQVKITVIRETRSVAYAK